MSATAPPAPMSTAFRRPAPAPIAPIAPAPLAATAALPAVAALPAALAPPSPGPPGGLLRGGSLVRTAAHTWPCAPGGGSIEAAERRTSRSKGEAPSRSSSVSSHLLGGLGGLRAFIARLLPLENDLVPASARAS